MTLAKLSGFGRYELRDKTSRSGRNPKTGEEITITSIKLADGYAVTKQFWRYGPQTKLYSLVTVKL